MHVTLKGETEKRFATIKEYWGLTTNTDLLAALISEEYKRVTRKQRTKVFLPNEVYDRVEKAAALQGLTIDEYVDSVTEDLLKQKKEEVAEQKA